MNTPVATSIHGPFLTATDTAKFQRLAAGIIPSELVKGKPNEKKKKIVSRLREEAKGLSFVWAITEENSKRAFLKILTPLGDGYADIMTGQIYGVDGRCWSLDSMRISNITPARRSDMEDYMEGRRLATIVDSLEEKEDE